MSSYTSGHDAEIRVSNYLADKGFKILELNWKNRYCEIDIVAKKNDTIYFVEVKYRQKSDWGTGLDYITPKKLKQMRFASEFWVSENDWRGDYNLAVADVSPTEVKFIDCL